MTQGPLLFDRDALTRHRARAAATGSDPFLHRAALDEVQDRLSMVKRSFTAPAIVTGLPEFWRAVFPDATIVADEDTLALEAGAHDLVIHAMALHWANDPVGQIIQCRRALVPDGLFLCVALGGRTLAELRHALTLAESEIAGGLSPRVAPMAELREAGALLQRAGLALPVADSVSLTAEYRDLPHLMHDLRAMGETGAMTGRPRHATRRALFARAELLYRAEFANPDNRLPATFELICLTGWAPDANQPQPLRPGSAQARLADALNSTETRLPD